MGFSGSCRLVARYVRRCGQTQIRLGIASRLLASRNSPTEARPLDLTEREGEDLTETLGAAFVGVIIASKVRTSSQIPRTLQGIEGEQQVVRLSNEKTVRNEGEGRTKSASKRV